ncbi:MAG: glycosyltransferase family 39 protein [Anaerolineales bacterium]|nr:glycosyltransferase family 39 protein [Anaerolineales bacterium]
MDKNTDLVPIRNLLRKGWENLSSSIFRIWNSPGIKLAIVVFIISKVVLSLWVVIVRQVFDAPLPPQLVLRFCVGVEVSDSIILEPWQRWDTLHYQAIAERGYSAFEWALFVPPLYPLLIRGVSFVLGENTLLSGILISNIAYLLGLIAFYHYAFEESKDEKISGKSLIYLASFPASFFFLAAYTESLFLLSASLTLLFALQRRWFPAGIWGGFAALSRLTGAILIIPLTYAAFTASRSSKDWKPWISVIGTATGAAIFPLYTWWVLDKPPWTPVLIQSARFSGGFSFPGLNVLHAFERIFLGKAFMVDYIDLAFILIFAVLAVPVFLKLSRLSVVFYLSYLTLYLVREAGGQPLLGTARYVLVFLPAYIILAKAGTSRRIHRIILYTSWMLLLFMLGQFAIWGWVG